MVAALDLEPFWGSLSVGQTVDVQADLVIHDGSQQKHLLRSLLHRKFFVVQGELQKKPYVSLLGATVIQGPPRFELSTQHAFILHHDVPGEQSFNTVVEACAGMSIMSQGAESCGMCIRASNDIRPSFCRVIEATGRSTAVCGDIGDRATLHKLYQADASSSIMMAGFSCQPWSKLGDQRGYQDIRASTLPDTLRASFFLRCHTIVLECVTSAGEDRDVKETLQQFMKLTGFRMGQTTLKLENLMPAKRHRWWAVLVLSYRQSN